MKCPKCLGPTFVLQTRHRKDGAIRRRRQCRVCPCRFTTYQDFGSPAEQRSVQRWDTAPEPASIGSAQ